MLRALALLPSPRNLVLDDHHCLSRPPTPPCTTSPPHSSPWPASKAPGAPRRRAHMTSRLASPSLELSRHARVRLSGPKSSESCTRLDVSDQRSLLTLARTFRSHLLPTLQTTFDQSLSTPSPTERLQSRKETIMRLRCLWNGHRRYGPSLLQPSCCVS